MKLLALLGAGVLAAGTLGAAPVEAQRYGYHDGYRDGHGYRGERHVYRDGRGWRDGRGHRGGRGWRGNYGYRGRPRVVCRWHHGYRGSVRRCFRAF